MKKTLYIFIVLSTPLFAQVNLTNALEVCLRFNGNTLDGSNNNNHGVLSGNVTPTTDRVNNASSAYQFNGGSNDFISVATFSSIALEHELSISMWAKVDVLTSTCLFQLQPDNANDRCVACAQYSGVGLIWDYGSIYTNGRITQNTTWDTQWHHYVFVISADQGFKGIYMDGTLMSSVTTFGLLQNKNFPLYIGAGTSSVGNGSLRWRGKIDEVYIWSRMISQQEVTALFNGAIPCLLENPVGLGENVASAESHLFPNPNMNGLLFFSGNAGEISSLQITDLAGKVIRSFRNSDFQPSGTLKVGFLSDGCYFVNYIRRGILRTEKLVICGQD